MRVREPDGPTLVELAVTTLLDAALPRVHVVLGAAPAAPVPSDPRVSSSVAAGWAEGMGASLRHGLAHLAATADGKAIDAVLVHLVDLPGVTTAAVRTVLAALPEPGPQRQATLLRAVVGGIETHPVVLGRAHWDGVAASAHGDRGARDYLRAHPPRLVPVSVPGTALTDLDTLADLAHYRATRG